jgi:hypothetical protein
MLFIGKNHAEAIDWVQDTLGPVTPRNIAEDTYRVLCAEGVIDVDLDCIIISEDLDTEDLRRRARNTVVTKASQRAGTRRIGRRAVGSQGTGMHRHSRQMVHEHDHKSRRHNRITDNSADATNKKVEDDD